MSVHKTAALTAELATLLTNVLHTISIGLPLELQTKSHVVESLAKAEAAAQSLALLATVADASLQAVEAITHPQAPAKPVE